MNPTQSTALTALTATDIADAVRSRRITAVQVAQAHLDRIAALDGELGAFQTVDPARVLAEAEAVDARPDLARLPLAGVPVAVKDNMAAIGHPARHGSPAVAPVPAVQDDEIVRRVRAAGAVIVGVTRMPELAAWAFAQSRLGVTRQPGDRRLDPGGSTGGGAVAVAAGMAALAVGTDGGGSIRVPAAYCGIVGVKPGSGVVPLPGDLAEHWCGLTQAGPLARTVADAALLLTVLSGAAAGEAASAPTTPPVVAVSMRSPSPLARPTADIRATVRAAAAILTGGGCRVIDAEPPYPASLIQRWSRRWHAGIALDAERLGLSRSDLEPRTAAMVGKGRRVLRFGGPRPAVARAWRQAMIDWFDRQGVDAILLPVTAGPAIAAGSLQGAGYLRTWLDGAKRIPYTQAWNLAGLPAVVVPVRSGGPAMGVQLVGKPGQESALLRLAAAIESAAS